jgi:hypothetical protein
MLRGNALAPIIVGAIAISLVSIGGASAGVPYSHAFTYSESAPGPGLVQNAQWHHGWHHGWGGGYGWHHGYGWHGGGWGPGRWCYWHPYACGH